MNRRRVLVLEDDYLALRMIVGLLTRDERTVVCGEASTPRDLLQLARTSRPDNVLLEAEYIPQEPPLYDLLHSLREQLPRVPLICQSKAANPEYIRAAIRAGIQGYFLKNEVAMAIVPAILRTNMERMTISSGVEPALREMAIAENIPLVKLPTWHPNPHLSPKLLESFILRVVYGMRAARVARKSFVQEETIEKYMTKSYEIVVGDCSVEESDLEDVALDKMSPEDRAMHWFTAFPKAKRRG